MRKEKLLMTPGPTMLPPEVLSVMGRQIIHHRTEDFTSTLDGLQESLRPVFGTDGPILVFASSGTGGMEAAIANLFSRGEAVLNVSVGAFGERMGRIAEAFGLEVIDLSHEYGEAADVGRAKAALEGDAAGRIKGVLLTHNETSTGVTNDVRAFAALTEGTARLLVVDAISALGGLEMRMGEWGVDCVFAGSQKSLMAPPGLSFTALSEKAWEATRRSDLPKFYWDYGKYRKGITGELAENPPYTPAITLMMAQRAALDLMRAEGLANVYARHARLAKAVRAGAKALGFAVFPDERVSSDIITALTPPEGVKPTELIKAMNDGYDVMVAGGQGKLKGKILRIGHCGYSEADDVLRAISALERASWGVGHRFGPGAGVAAAQREIMGGSA